MVVGVIYKVNNDSRNTGVANKSISYYKKGIVLLQQKEHSLAIDSFNKAISLTPNFKRAYVYKGSALDDLHKYQEAMKTLIKPY